jgi:hypothetical protein
MDDNYYGSRYGSTYYRYHARGGVTVVFESYETLPPVMTLDELNAAIIRGRIDPINCARRAVGLPELKE